MKMRHHRIHLKKAKNIARHCSLEYLDYVVLKAGSHSHSHSHSHADGRSAVRKSCFACCPLKQLCFFVHRSLQLYYFTMRIALVVLSLHAVHVVQALLNPDGVILMPYPENAFYNLVPFRVNVTFSAGTKMTTFNPTKKHKRNGTDFSFSQ